MAHLHDEDHAYGFHCLSCNAIVPVYGDPGTQRCPDCVAAGITARAPVDEADDSAEETGGDFVCGYGGHPRCRVRLERRGLCEVHTAQLRAIVAKRPVRRHSQEQEDKRTAYAERRAEEARERTEAKAADVLAFVLASQTFPVQRRHLAAALGDGAVLGRAIEHVAAERSDVIWHRSRPAVTGFYLPGDEPTLKPIEPEPETTRADVDEADRRWRATRTAGVAATVS